MVAEGLPPAFIPSCEHAVHRAAVKGINRSAVPPFPEAYPDFTLMLTRLYFVAH